MATSHAGADLLDAPLVLRDLRAGDRATRMLASLQSNIVHPHVRSHLRLLALRIDDPGGARRGLAGLASSLKSAAGQLDELAAFRAHGTPGTPFVTIAISATGYARLGVDPLQWPRDPAFLEGMAARNLGDPAPAEQGEPYRDGIDLLVVVGSHDDVLTGERVRAVLRALDGACHLLADETGNTLTNSMGDGIEHFGYVDGRSQPLFVADDLDRTAERTDRWNPLVPLAHVLVPDPGSEHAFGSYLVYRKLEQNVRAFKRQEARIAVELGLGGKDAERAGALLVGRFEDGTPLALAPLSGLADPAPNDFTYDGDDAGARCPLGAHVRRMNARTPDPAARIVLARRGQGYGRRTDDPADDDIASKPTGGVGLLFLAVVARLEGQFEQLQRAANGDDDGPFDAIAGQSRAAEARMRADLRRTWDEPSEATTPLEIEPVVRLLGGEYLFLPSIEFLRGLVG